MRSIGWTYKWVNVKVQARDLRHNPANLILSVIGVVSIVTVAFLGGTMVRQPLWGGERGLALLEQRDVLTIIVLAYCGFFGVVTFVLTLIALFYPPQVAELDRLRSLPIPEGTLFDFKCGDVLHSLTPLVFLVALAAGVGMNVGGEVGLGFVAVLLVLSILLVHVVGWLMMSVVLAGVTLVPRALLGRSALLVAVLVLGASGVVAVRAVDRGRALDALAAVGPTAWVADLVLAARAGRWAEAGRAGALVAAIALALRTLAWLSYRSLYLRRLTPLLEKVSPETEVVRGGGLVETLLAPISWASSATVAIARKDLRWIARDAVMGYAVWAAAALVVLGAGIAVWEGTRPVAEESVAWPIWGMVLLIAVGHLVNLNLSAFGREERCLEALRAAPVTPGQLLLAKAYVAFVVSLPVVGLAAALVAVSTRGAEGSASAIRSVLAVGVLGAAAFAWISATLGALFPKYDAKSQFRAATLVGVGVHAALLGLLLASAVGAWAALRAYGAAFWFVPAAVAAIWAGVMAFLGREARLALHALLGTASAPIRVGSSRASGRPRRTS